MHFVIQTFLNKFASLFIICQFPACTVLINQDHLLRTDDHKICDVVSIFLSFKYLLWLHNIIIVYISTVYNLINVSSSIKYEIETTRRFFTIFEIRTDEYLWHKLNVITPNNSTTLTCKNRHNPETNKKWNVNNWS